MNKNKSATTITLDNDQRFVKDLTLTLDNRLTVFTGAMGSGKTTLLEALANNPLLPCRVFTNKVCLQYFDMGNMVNFSAFALLVDSLDVTLPFTAYSSSQQSIIRLYCSIANALEFVCTDDRLLVLIDDLGNDLHPIWQHKILPLLLKDFSKVQFIITTVSPLVLTHVQPDSLFFVENSNKKIKIRQATESYGKTSERILEDLQGLKTTRPIEVKDCIDQFYQYLNSGDLVNAEKELEIAQDMTGHNIDPELTRMELRLKTVSRQNSLNSCQNDINHNYTLGK